MIIIAALLIGFSLLAQEMVHIAYMDMKLDQLEDSLDYALISSKLNQLNEKLKTE